MPRYIDADALKDRMLNYYECVNAETSKSDYRGETLMNYEVADMIEDCIDNAPTADVVEVVRCKDCMYCKEFHYEEPGEEPYIKLMCKWSCYSHQPNDFCSYGERKGANEHEKI